MKTKKRFLAVVLAAALLVAGLTGCKDALRGVAQKITGSSGEVQEEDTTRWADATADPLIIQGIADASAKFDTAMVVRMLYPNMEITVHANCCAGVTPEKHKAALEVMKSCQINVVEGE